MAEKIPPIKKQLTNDEWATLILLATLIIGSWLRLNPALLADGFPLNDGGMFYTMIRDLRQNHYALPAYTTYNNLNIPFVYPPLPFYLAGGLADLFHVSDLTVLLWLPALVNILTLPAFALLAHSMLGSRLKTALATTFYAFTLLSMDWLLMGGGLTRGLGQLGMILTSAGAYRLFTRRSRKNWLFTILSGTLVVTSHPEFALLTVISVVIIWFFIGRSKQATLDAVSVGACITGLISPWLAIVLPRFGLAPFLRASQTSGSELMLWVQTFSFQFTQETSFSLIAVLGLIGFFISLKKRSYLLPAWMLIPALFDPRSSARVSVLPIVMLASLCVTELILPALNWAETAFFSNEEQTKLLRSKVAKFFIGYVYVYMVLGAYGLGLRMADIHLRPEEVSAMNWVRENTAQEARFIVLTGNGELMRNPVQEWFPALSQRRSETTIQGREWTWGNQFIKALSSYQNLENCVRQDLFCLQEQTPKLGILYNHIYIQKDAGIHCPANATCRYSQGLIEELKNAPDYQLIFENERAIIFRATR